MRKLTDIILKLDINCILGNVNQNITSIAYDSRKVENGGLFVAIKGTHSDGHNYIQQAINDGAIAIISEIIITDYISTNIPIIIVNNSRLALAKVAHSFYDYPSERLTMIGVTGTNGKTSITYILKSLLEKNKQKIGLIGTNGILLGKKYLPSTHTTPESLELAKLLSEMAYNGCSTVIMEVSSHALSQHRVYGINFDNALFTNLSQDHLDYHKDMESYAQSKKILFNSLSKQAIAIVNSDSDYASMMTEDTNAKLVTVGRNKQSDYLISKEKLSSNGIKFDLDNNSNDIHNNYHISSNLVGKFNISNLSLALVTARLIGLKMSLLQEAVLDGLQIKGRMERYNLPNNVLAIVDYAHTPDALENALLACKEILKSNNSNNSNRENKSNKENNSKLIVIFGCGGDRDNSKRGQMGKIASTIADKIIITSDNPRNENPNNIIKDIISGIAEKLMTKISIQQDRKEAIAHTITNAHNGDLILIAGKGHETYQVIGTEKIDFDDAEIVKSLSS